MNRASNVLAFAALLIGGSLLEPSNALAQSRVPAANTAPEPTAFAVMAERDEDGLFRLTGSAEGHAIDFVVDTGATTTVLSARDAARLGLRASGADHASTLRTAGGSTAMVWRKLPRLDIAGTTITDVDVVVVRNGLDRSLLGQDILSRLGTITLRASRMEIRPQGS